MNFKVKLFLWCVCQTFHQINSNLMPNIGTDCISIPQLVKAMQILCENRNNATLWQHSINCHADINEKVLITNADCCITVNYET